MIKSFAELSKIEVKLQKSQYLNGIRQSKIMTKSENLTLCLGLTA